MRKNTTHPQTDSDDVTAEDMACGNPLCEEAPAAAGGRENLAAPRNLPGAVCRGEHGSPVKLVWLCFSGKAAPIGNSQRANNVRPYNVG